MLGAEKEVELKTLTREADNEGEDRADMDSFAREVEVPKAGSSVPSYMWSIFAVSGENAQEVYPWANVIMISGVIGSIEYIPVLLLGWAIPLRLYWLDTLYEDYGLYAQVLSAIGTSVGLTFVALTMCLLFPAAKASGLPPIIAYLSNGKMINDDHFSVGTIAAKIVSVCAAISGGLAIGREGPAIHIGAAIGDFCYRWIQKGVELCTGEKMPFDGTARANVVMMGSAAGFASAFRAPIGGFMYILEELAVHWNIQEHTTTGSQLFLAVALSSFITTAIVKATQDTGSISFSSIIIFDDSTAETYSDTWKYNDIPCLLVLATVCGVFGGCYTRCAIFINSFRKEWQLYEDNWWMVYIDGALVAATTATILCCLPVLYTDCHSNPDYDDDHRRLASSASTRNYVQHSCDYQSFSEMASLSLSGEEAVIRHLLSRDNVYFSLPTLLVFMVFYVPLTLIVMGLPVSAGTFVPNLLLGSLFGRIIGKISTYVFTGDSDISHAGIFALIGAGALLGAWTRTMTAVVITIVEISGDVAVVIPLITCVIISRGIANKIAHHSYTHETFYKLIDMDSHADGDSPFVHPGDWAPIEKVEKGGRSVFKRVRRSTNQMTVPDESTIQMENIAAAALEKSEA